VNTNERKIKIEIRRLQFKGMYAEAAKLEATLSKTRKLTTPVDGHGDKNCLLCAGDGCSSCFR
jgi:hypothetical protein